jgi:hypothetical protein
MMPSPNPDPNPIEINVEGNCARKYRRLQTPMSISVAGKICAAKNWSPGGILFEAEGLALAEGVPQPSEMLLPCADGIFSLPVQISPARKSGRSWSCKFIDMPPRESAILHHYADAIFHGFSITIPELENAGRQPVPDPSALLEDAGGSFWSWSTWIGSLKRALIICVFIALIVGVGSFALPFFFKRVKSRLNEGDYYQKIAESRMITTQLSIDVLDAKLATTKDLLAECSGPNPQIRISDEQKKMLELGVNQLTAERKMLDVHMAILQADVEAVKKGDFFFEQSVLGGYGTEHQTDPVPYLTEVLADIAQDAKVSPRQTEDRQKYVMVAEDRLKQVQYQIHSLDLQKKSLEAIVARCKAQSAGALSQNSIDLTQRDIDLIDVDETRLRQLAELFTANITAVKAGNFLFETNLLQRYSPEITRPAPAATTDLTR